MVLMSLSSSNGCETKNLLGWGVEGRERAASATAVNSVEESDLTWADDGFGEADLKMLESDRWWPKGGRPATDGPWCAGQPATATMLWQRVC